MVLKSIKKQRGNININNFNQAINYIKISRKYIYFSIILFLIFAFLALFLPTPSFIVTQINDLIKSLAQKTAGLDSIGLIYFIFKNNLTVSLIGVIFGTIFAIVPIILVISNGYVIGYVIKMLILKLGLTAGIFNLWKLLPHGVFEIPAVMISLGIGIKLGVVLIHSLNKDSFQELKENLFLAGKVFLFIIVPLLLVAAIIEGSLIRIIG